MSVKRKLITDEEEVIQDSEPEREDARKRLKEERRRHRRPNKSDDNMSITTDYTSDSDTETSYAIAGTRTTGIHNGPGIPLTTPSVVSLSHSTVYMRTTQGLDQDAVKKISDSKDTTTSEIKSQIRSYDFAYSPQSSILPAPIYSEDIETDERAKKLRTSIGMFAYNDSRSQGSSASTRRMSRTPSFQQKSELQNSKSSSKGELQKAKKKEGNHTDYLGIPLSDLHLILSCVSCGLMWTTRKSVDTKIVHIQKCGKKRLLSDETLRRLILRELGKLMNGTTNQAVPKEMGTLLEDVIKERSVIQARKKTRTILSSIKPIVETRKDILLRAKLLLSRSHLTFSKAVREDQSPAASFRGDASKSSSCQTHSSKFEDDTAEEGIITFSRSKLPGVSASSYFCNFSMASDERSELPPLTQVSHGSESSSHPRGIFSSTEQSAELTTKT